MAPPTTAAAPRVRRIDGPHLPHLTHFSPGGAAPTASLVPLLAPPVASPPSDGHGEGADGDRCLLVPSPNRIVVRSARHGGRVGELSVPGGDRGDVCALCVARLPRRPESGDSDDDDEKGEETGSRDGGEGGEWVVLAARQTGVVHEWPTAGLSQASKAEEGAAPRRTWRLACDALTEVEVLHLTSVSHDDGLGTLCVSAEGGALYGLVKGKNSASDEGTWLVRCMVPPFRPSNEGEATLSITPLVPVKHISSKTYREEASKNQHVCLKSKDAVFGLAAAYRPSVKVGGSRMDYATADDDDETTPSGDVFVVLASSRGLAVYRDSLTRTDDDVVDPSRALVHLTDKLLHPPPLYTKDQTAFCSLAVAPGAKDLALGRASGHIEILDNLFANVASYLDALAKKEEGTKPPEKTTVRRTVHWHAHPVRALAFQSHGAAAAAPTVLLSGGEESVLATWQLDRNYHKPSDFVARVAAGGILHILCDGSAGRIVVFCADNSIRCFDATNSERAWAARGVASMALHAEDAARLNEGPYRGPIVALRDPITGHPMLTNLPGAPGTVHWYDPASASVVGTLEVAPYNRVSRRDPAVDPHVPAPIVTHLAVGRDGRDMVTVDAVWTENTSVGKACALPAPRGSVPMNVCTSIKFWRHEASPGGKSDQTKRRRAGDVPVNYALASAMAAPHGRDGTVCALSVAPGGDVACTLSVEEGAFRVWAKHTDAGAAPSGGATPWRCRYKVRTPSGYANLLSPNGAPSTGRRPVAFSSDGSVLAVAYGPYVTLWDHANAALLASLAPDRSDADGAGNEDVRTVDFLTPTDDAMLLTTARRIGVRSPCGGFPSRYLGDDEWSFDAGALGGDARVSAAAPLAEVRCASAGSRGCFAAAFAVDGGARSEVVVVRKDEGSVLCAEGTDVPLRWSVEGEVQSLCAESGAGPVVKLLAITTDGEMLSLRSGADPKARKGAASSLDVRSMQGARAPVLKLGSDTADAQPSVKRRKVSIVGSAGSDRAKGMAGFEFPQLSGKFTSAFIAKSLSR